MRRKHYILIGLTSILGVSGALIASTNNPISKMMGIRATDCEHSGYHYQGVAATKLAPGIKEYWVCCSCHEHFFAEDVPGDLGDFELKVLSDEAKEEILSNPADDRYVAPFREVSVTIKQMALDGTQIGVQNLTVDVSGTAKVEPAETVEYELKTLTRCKDYFYINQLSEDSVEEVIYYAELTPAWDGTTVADSFADGDGSEASPFLISNAEELAYMNAYETWTTTEQFFKLTAQIDLGGHYLQLHGTGTQNFNGKHFLGNNCSIRNINNVTTGATQYRSGSLFYGLAGTKGEISNLNLYGTVSTKSSHSTATNDATGALVALVADAKIINVANYCNVSGIANIGGIAGLVKGKTTLTNLVNYGNVNATNIAGGIAGYTTSFLNSSRFENYGTITISKNFVGGVFGRQETAASNYVQYAYNFGLVTSTLAGGDAYCGGVCGALYTTTLKDAQNYGLVRTGNASFVGGVVGAIATKLTAYIENATNYGSVRTTGTTKGSGVGGILGGLVSPTTSICHISNSVNAGTVRGEERVGGIAGSFDNADSTVTGCSNNGIVIAKPGATMVGDLIGKAA